MTSRIRKRVHFKRVQSQINITPLIDILLVLIVIFMVITPVTPTGLDAEIPKQPPTPEAVARKTQESLVLNVDQRGALTLNHKRVNSTAELSAELQDIFKTRGDRTIYVQGSRDLDFDDVMHVIDAARGGGADRIGLMTVQIH